MAMPAMGQRITASIQGTVTDPSGSPIPGVSISAVNAATGTSRDTVTNEAGNYSLGALQVGTWDLSAELDGFKTANIDGVALNVADRRQVNFQLELGAVTEEITTTAASVPVETISGEVAGLVTGEQIRELPLNGRNFVQLTQLMPGVSTLDNFNTKNKGLLAGVDMSVSGSMATGNSWTIDGSSNNDTGSNRTIMVYPSVDAIEEFKIHRNSYGPEFGGSAGAQVNLVTRGGTNQYKGSAFVFYRNDSLNEKNYFLEQAGADKEELDRQDYGFTFGGPIIKDKVHFFLSGEINDETRGVVRSAAVPTAAERAGDFSSSIPGCSQQTPIDPLTGSPFPGNVIPGDRLSPGGLAFLNLYPQPNRSPSAGACNNWVGSVPTAIDWAQINGRVDWSVNQKTQVLLRYTKDTWENGAPNAGGANGLWGDDPFPAVDSAWDQPGESLVAQLNQVIGSSSINTVTFSLSGNEINITRGDTQGLNDQINQLIPAVFPDSEKLNGTDRSHPVYWGGATGTDLWTIAPWDNKLDHMTLKDDYEQVFGNHFFKAGVLYQESEKKENIGGASAFETPHFWGATGIGDTWGGNSGNRIADILIRDMYHGYDETAFQPSPFSAWEDVEVYVGDSWKVRDNLTVDLGVRYSRYKEVYTKENDIVAFYPNLFDPALGNAPCNGIAQVPGTDPCGEAGLAGGADGVSRSFVHPDDDNFAPRFGMAWDVFGTGKSVVRAGFGQFFQRERINIILDFAGQPPFTANTNGHRPLDSAPPLGAVGFGTPVRGIDPNNQTPYNMQFNLTWEQQLSLDSTLEVSYVGSRGRHLVSKGDINFVSSGDTNGNGISDRLDYLRGGGDGDGSVRPFFTGGGNRILYWVNDGVSEYDGLQTQYQLRFGRGSQFQASYTYSNFEANTSVNDSGAGEGETQITDFENRNLDFGKAEFHRDHLFNASMVWNLPTFEGQGGFKEWVLGDWTIGGVASYASGQPITPYVDGFDGLANGYYGTGFGNNARPLQIGACGGGGSGQQVLSGNGLSLNGIVLGDTSQAARRGICEGPDFFQVDLSFYKNIKLGSRLDAQFRIEIFNLTNEVNFIGNDVRNNIDPQNEVYDTGNPATASRIVSADIGGGFGEATSVRDPRQIQLGLKLFF